MQWGYSVDLLTNANANAQLGRLSTLALVIDVKSHKVGW